MTPPPKPLHGLRVLDLSRVLAGPFCTMNLGDLGAEVIKVEEPGQGDDTRAFGPPFAGGVSTYFLSINRNKKSLAVNLKDPRGLEIVKRLARISDVVVENFRPGVAARLKLSYGDLHPENPKLVYCSISGFGHRGLPEHSRLPGYDVVVQGMSGLQHLTGDPDGPPTRAGVPIADILTGMTAFQAIAVALFVREREGRGQHLDIAMLDSTVQVLTFQAAAHLTAGTRPTRLGNRHPSISPYETFRAQDGYFNLAVGNDAQFKKLCELIAQPAWPADPRFATNPLRVQHRPELAALLAHIFGAHPVRHWLHRLAEAGIPAGPISDLEEALSHPQLLARGGIAQMQHPQAGSVRLVANPLPLEGVTPPPPPSPPPALGEHTREILAGVLKYGDSEIDALARSGAVGLGAP
ncbi:MAG TPA: CoA transferase [Myxococcaceae bacterium]|nr:CoA transferase [Myxococcaceae bacterium]